MQCAHSGFHTLLSQYDRERGELIQYWYCERCQTRLDEANRESYRPHFDPHGNDRYLATHAERVA